MLKLLDFTPSDVALGLDGAATSARLLHELHRMNTPARTTCTTTA
jgi:hypothetical protein